MLSQCFHDFSRHCRYNDKTKTIIDYQPHNIHSVLTSLTFYFLYLVETEVISCSLISQAEAGHVLHKSGVPRVSASVCSKPTPVSGDPTETETWLQRFQRLAKAIHLCDSQKTGNINIQQHWTKWCDTFGYTSILYLYLTKINSSVCNCRLLGQGQRSKTITPSLRRARTTFTWALRYLKEYDASVDL